MDKFTNKLIFFVTADVKRGLGLEDALPSYHILCAQSDPLISVLRRQGAKIYCLEEEGVQITKQDNNAGRILENQKVSNYIQKNTDSDAYIAYFKPSPKIDSLIQACGYKAIGNTSDINEQFENKINSAIIFKKYLSDYSVPTIINRLGDLSFSQLQKHFSTPFILQFGHGWAGRTTHLIHSESDFQILKNRFTHTRVRVSPYIDSYTILNNCCIYKNEVLVGPPALQVNGIKILDDNPFATSGRQWPDGILEDKQKNIITLITTTVGKLLLRQKYKGFFGIDFLVEKKTGRIFVSEINARLTASTAFYTKRERVSGHIPLFAYHLAAYMEKDLDTSLYTDHIQGTQIIIRNQLTASQFENYPEVGTYALSNSKIRLMEKSYHPERLQKDEFILLKRNTFEKNDSEKERIETVNSAVDRKGIFTSFMQDILSAHPLEKVDKH